MKLEIVWRNPQPTIRAERTVHRIQTYHSCAVYVATNADLAQEFVLIFGEVA